METNSVLELTAFDTLRESVKEVAEENAKLTFNYREKQGNRDARSHVHKLRTKKAEIEKVRKALKADSLEYGRKVDAIAKELTSMVSGMIEHHQGPITQIEEEERQRVQRHTDNLNQLLLGRIEHTNTADELTALIEEVSAISTDESWEEFEQRATEAKASLLAAAERALGMRREQEEQQRQIEQLKREKAEAEAREKAEAKKRAEAERRAQEKAEQDRREREAAERAAEQARKDAEAKAQAEIDSIKREAEAAKEAAKEEVERLKWEAEERARREAEVAQAKQAEAERVAKRDAELEARRLDDERHAARMRRAEHGAVFGNIGEDADTFVCFRDGNAWCAVRPDFINLSESHAGFGPSPSDAYSNLTDAEQESPVQAEDL